MVVGDQQPDHAGAPARGRRDAIAEIAVPDAWLGLDLQRPGDAPRSAAASRPGRSRRRRTRPAGRVEADAVVADVQGDHLLHVRQRHTDAGRLRVLGHVRQRLLRRPEQGGLGLGVHHRGVPVVVELYGDSRAERTSADDVGDRLAQPRRLQAARDAGRAPSGAPRAGSPGPADCGLSTCRRQSVGVLGGLELGDDPGQALRERVVDLAGHPLPLVEHAGLAGLGQRAGRAGSRSPPGPPRVAALVSVRSSTASWRAG